MPEEEWIGGVSNVHYPSVISSYSHPRLGSPEADAEFGVQLYIMNICERKVEKQDLTRRAIKLYTNCNAGSTKPLPKLPSAPSLWCKNCALERPYQTGMATPLYSFPSSLGRKRADKQRLSADDSCAANLEGESEWYTSASSTTSKRNWV